MGWGGVVCTVISMSNPTGVLCCVGVGVLKIKHQFKAGLKNIDAYKKKRVLFLSRWHSKNLHLRKSIHANGVQ